MSKVSVVIGRFQPFHNGHLDLVNQALDKADRVIILVGSCKQPRTIKNPFTFEERKGMILQVFKNDNRITVLPTLDYAYNDNLWISEIQKTVYDATNKGDEVSIVGYEKDQSSWYLHAFPNWKYVSVGAYLADAGGTTIDATKLRKLWFTKDIAYASGVIPPEVYTKMVSFANTEEFTTLVDEFNFITSYKKAWEAAPYAPTFMTVDAVLLQGGHVLLVKRKASPGKGLWALPGGFLNQDETTRQACIRELREETRVKVPVPVLNGSITHEKLFDKPDRSLRGRTLTQAYLIELNTGDHKLPSVKGSDDAEEAKWFPIAEISNMSELMFEDHHSIVTTMIGFAK